MTWQSSASSLTYNGGVSGSWTNGGSGWLDGVAPATWNNATPDAAIFGGISPTTVNVDGGVTVGNISVSSGTYTFAGSGTLTLSSTTWDVASGLTNTVSTALAGTTGFTKTNAGVLLFSGTNKNFTGSVTINGGAIQITNALAGNLGTNNSTAITLNGGALHTQFVTNNTAVNYAITVGASGGQLRNLGNDNQRFTFVSNKIGGSGTLTLSFGTQNTRFMMGSTTTQNSFNGKWVIDSGGNVSRFVDVDGANTFGNVTGDDAITLLNSGTILFRETRTYGTNSSGTYGITVGAGGGNIAAGGGKTVTVAAKLSGASTDTLRLDLGATNSVMVLVNTNNSWLGATTLANSGTLRIGAAGVIADGAGTIDMASTTKLDLNGFAETIGGLAGAGTVSSSTGTGVLTAGANNSNSTFAGLLANGAGTLALSKVGTGNLTLSTSNSFSGGTTVQAGRLTLANANALGGGDVQVQSASTNQAILSLSGVTVSGKTVTLDSTTAKAILLSTSGASTWNGTITLAGGAGAVQNIEFTTEGSAPLTVGGTVGGSIGNGRNLTLRGVGTTNVLSAGVNIGATPLGKTDNGVWRIASSGNTWGTTTISVGTLEVGASDALPDATAVTVDSAGTLNVNGYNETVGSIAGAGKIDNSGAAAALTVGGDNTSTTFSGVLTNSGSALSLTKAGNGTLTLSGSTSNAFTGSVLVSSGTLELGKTAGVSALSGSSLTVQSGAALLLSSSDQVAAANVTLSGGTIRRASGVSEVFGDLTLTTASFLDYGSGSAGSMAFGSYTPSSLLTVNNFFAGNQLVFTSQISSGDLDTLFAFDNGFTTNWSGSEFTITAVPEGSTSAAGLMLMAFFAAAAWRRIRMHRKDGSLIRG